MKRATKRRGKEFFNIGHRRLVFCAGSRERKKSKNKAEEESRGVWGGKTRKRDRFGKHLDIKAKALIPLFCSDL